MSLHGGECHAPGMTGLNARDLMPEHVPSTMKIHALIATNYNLILSILQNTILHHDPY